MKLDQYFNAPRFFQLLKIEGYLSYRKIIILGAATFAFLFFIGLINGADRDFEDFHQIFFPLVLLGGGFLFTSRVFNELNIREDRMSYLSLPASILEKLASKWFISAILYSIVIALLYWLFAQVLNMVTFRFWSYEFHPFQPFSKINLLLIELYIVIQSVFLIGATAFNKYVLPKTILSLFVVFLILSIITYILVRVTFGEIFDGLFSITGDQPPIQPSDGLQEFIVGPLWKTIQYLFWFALAPLFWIVSYFKLKEREV